jgi:hypothetical protein
VFSVYMYERMYVRNVGRYVSTVCTFGVRMYMLACLFVCMFVLCTCVRMWVCEVMYPMLYVCMYVGTYARTCVCTYVRMYRIRLNSI